MPCKSNLEKKRLYRLRHPDKVREQHRRYRKRHPDKIKKQNERYCEKKLKKLYLENPEKFEKKLEKKILKYFGTLTRLKFNDILPHRCEICNSIENLNIHHCQYIYPIRKEHLIRVCRQCHVLEHQKLDPYLTFRRESP